MISLKAAGRRFYAAALTFSKDLNTEKITTSKKIW
jgi:hypothetical protein